MQATGYFEVSKSKGTIPIDSICVKAIFFNGPQTCVRFCAAKYEREESGLLKNTVNGMIRYTGTQLGKIILVRGNVHLSVFQLSSNKNSNRLALSLMRILFPAEESDESFKSSGEVVVGE